ncbi:hypothetical protein KORDIASMS9_00848 [Kordia sp. SMS9]|uniref:hypothetical protein n=1 Tax=Kordia sp. SMS9 TaxID=2282170 RepID=UPI000E1075EB|nr:hypothetical protein [Kordia sp. SMS9]AXG68632.1 hypothetical protein KORDIASMS9_00848 [Kordia sp. SMS9]
MKLNNKKVKEMQPEELKVIRGGKKEENSDTQTISRRASARAPIETEYETPMPTSTK